MEGPKVPLGTPESVGLSSQRLDRIDAYIRSLVEKGQRPNGMVLVARRGVPVYCKGFGLQNDGLPRHSIASEPKELRQDSIFRIYSMTKPITSLALMMLYEEGCFQLSDPAFLYLGKAWKKQNMRVWKKGLPKDGNVETEDCNKNITVLHLLTHTSGLSYGFDESGLVNPVDAAYHASGFLKEPRSLADFVAKLAEMPLLFQPGSCWNYGFNTDVCAYLIEVLSGKPFAEFLQERIFAPLGMVDTAFFVPAEKQHRFCDCYFDTQSIGRKGIVNISKSDGQLKYLREPSGTGSTAGGGGLVSTMYDYLRFCQCIMNGGELDGARLVSVKTVEWMATNHLPQNQELAAMLPDLGPQYTETAQPGQGFGLGFSVAINHVAGHVIGSNGVLFWGGLANTVFWLDPAEEIICIWMTQVIGSPQRDPVRNHLRQLVYACITDRNLKARL